jgi:hypothetical protein
MFIVYNHIDDLKSPSKKWQVQSYQNIRRNQARANLPKLEGSGRARKPRSFKWQRIRAETDSPRADGKTGDEHEIKPIGILAEEIFLEPLESPLKSSLQTLRGDPFDSYPMRATKQVSVAVDYCECPGTRLRPWLTLSQSHRYTRQQQHRPLEAMIGSCHTCSRSLLNQKHSSSPMSSTCGANCHLIVSTTLHSNKNRKFCAAEDQ